MKNKISIILLILIISFALIIQNGSAEDTPPVGQSSAETPSDVPVGQPIGDEGLSADIFGEKAGNFHPFVLLEEKFTSNFFATESNEKSDFITTVEPGIWFAFPGNKERLLKLGTNTTSPGGLKLSRVKPEAVRRYQAYLLYSPEFTFYSSHSNLDHVNHKAEGLLQYNLNSGLSFDLVDLFNIKEAIAGNNVTNTLYKHQDNLIDFIITYDAPSGKFKIQSNYSNYNLDYQNTGVNYRDRIDNSYGLSLYYHFWPKTAIFGEYNFSDIEFSTGSTYDSVEHKYYGGVQWDVTARTRGTLKLGYMTKDFSDASVKDQDGYSVELQTQHNLTPKRALQINGFRKFNESDLGGASSFLTSGVSAALLQKFTEKWSGTLNASYTIKDYNGITREDKTIGLSPAVRFEAKKWMIFDFGYQYYNRDSSAALSDYIVHELYLRAAFTM